MYVAGGLLILRCAGFRISRLSASAARRGTWGFGVILALSSLVNLASQSGWERLLMAPVSLVLAVLTFVVARLANR